MTTIWILGAGRFGLRAGKKLTRKEPDARICIIDHDLTACRYAHSQGFQVVQSDGVVFLSRMLGHEHTADWIIPAIPVHVAFKWVEDCLSHHFQLVKIPIPDSLVAMLPNPFKGPNHTIYTSIADFKCPEDCPEPRDVCTVTGKKKKRDMFRVLAEVHYPPFQSLVIRSRQLAPGVGGYRPQQLFDLLEQVRASRGDLFVNTACRCHGVVSGFHRF